MRQKKTESTFLLFWNENLNCEFNQTVKRIIYSKFISIKSNWFVLSFLFLSLSQFVSEMKQDMNRARFYKGIKGPKLILNGFSYFRNNSNPERTYWLCSRNRYQKCKARLITLHATRDVIIKNQNHNHGPEKTNEEEELTFETVLIYLNAMNDNLKVESDSEPKTNWFTCLLFFFFLTIYKFQ